MIEIAATHRGLRAGVLTRLAERAETLRKHQAPLRELHDALLVDARVAPTAQWKAAEWKDAITPLVETFHDVDPTDAGREFWQRTAYDLTRTYG